MYESPQETKKNCQNIISSARYKKYNAIIIIDQLQCWKKDNVFPCTIPIKAAHIKTAHDNKNQTEPSPDKNVTFHCYRCHIVGFSVCWRGTSCKSAPNLFLTNVVAVIKYWGNLPTHLLHLPPAIILVWYIIQPHTASALWVHVTVII